jgi:hypothetical protein
MQPGPAIPKQPDNSLIFGSTPSFKSQPIDIGRYKVRSLMRRARHKPVWQRKFIHTTDSNHALPIAEN